MSDPEQLLRDALQDRADRTPYDATPLGEVETSAHRLRRRRRTVVAGLAAAAAVVAVVVPLAVVANRDPGTDPAPAPTTTPSVPPSTQPPSTTPPPDPTMQVGDAPRIAYAESQNIHEPDGQVFVLPGDRGVSGFVAYRGGYLVADNLFFEGSVRLTRYDADGSEVASWTSTGRPVSSADGSLVAWSSFSHSESATTAPTLVHLGSANGEEAEQTQEVDLTYPSVVGLLDDEVVLQDFYERGVWVTDLTSAPRRIDGLDSATDVSSAQGLVAGGLGAAGRVVDADTGEVVWERPGITVGAFSPDGRYAVTTANQGGRREIVEALTGDVVAEVEASGSNDFPTLFEMTWEDDTHLLAVARRNCCDAVVRVDLRGQVTTAADGGIGVMPIVLAGQPS